MIVGVVKESFPGERRVALVPDLVPMLAKRGYEVVIEAGAGTQAGFLDAAYEAKGAQVLAGRDDVFAKAEILVHVRMGGANPERGADDLPRYREGQVVIGAADPLSHPEAIRTLAERGVHAFGLELIPRTTRAQAMDILSSMATVAGYRAVLWAADRLPKFFPMFMTAAGTVAPAKVFIVGAGVAGLQAIATAKRLGAVVSAYDVRPAVKEEVESLGGKFVEMELETAEGEGGYAKAMDEAFYERQREMMLKVVAESDVVITTAAIPGRKAPILVTAEMVAGMAPGSVIIDLAAERGGNCELTRVDEVVESGGVTVLGPSNVPSSLPYHASQMVSRNAVNFLLNMLSKPENPRDRDHVAVFDLEQEDDIMAGTWMTKGGAVVHEAVLEKLGATTGGQA